ncbi:uncharacterized protein N7515_000581 [Penicillium bovifimosum]|uniref:Myb-like domain-containing protein n=1 Tax=Penicillium bovifimosum TaxID=126998 RepID=A0A9W9HFN4_9EURO|nr:uncharacterized protein N7515_000581 [Penicillium bovifimosum]KAJ5146017.1 hypothetical protein N7515_000581 [Penicillium bovifimosum]
MLLPSALPCDVRRSSRFTPSRLFSTPPPSDTYPSGNGLLRTCRALQSLLNRSSPAPSTRRSKPQQRLQSPLPLTAPRRSPRTQNQKTIRPVSPRQTPPPQTAPHTPPPPPSAPARGANKRRRDDDEDETSPRNRFATPKRTRHVPYNMPLGLSSTDFYSLHSPPVTQSPPSARRRVDMGYNSFQRIDPDTPVPSIEVTECASALEQDVWSPQEDQDLIELVLERCRLSQAEWDECARLMGRRDVGDRWRVLVGEGLRPRR